MSRWRWRYQKGLGGEVYFPVPSGLPTTLVNLGNSKVSVAGSQKARSRPREQPREVKDRSSLEAMQRH